MQTLANLGHSVYRIVFRGGSPQRIRYSDRLLIGSVLAFVCLTIASQLLFFRSSIIETGLLLFTSLCGIYIGVAWLTRSVPRMRLRPSLLAAMLMFSAAEAVLLFSTPLIAEVRYLRFGLDAIVLISVLLGLSNILRFALGTSRSSATLVACAFAAALGAFYVTLHALLATLFG